MHARSATIHADPRHIEDGMRVVRDELMPAILELDGCLGLSMLADRAAGRCIITTTWTSGAAMRAARQTACDLVEQAREPFGSGEMTVDEWEIALLHRPFMACDGSCARVTWLQGDPAVLPDALENLPLTLLPRIDDTQGFCGLDLFVDRTTGDCRMTGFYEDRHTLELSRDRTEGLRLAMAEHMGMTITEIAELELPIQHLQVPKQL